MEEHIILKKAGLILVSLSILWIPSIAESEIHGRRRYSSEFMKTRYDRWMENQGCNDGFMEMAFVYIQKKGLTLEDDYPYNGKDGTCKKKKSTNHTVKITSYKAIPANNEKALQAAVAKLLISVAIDAGGYSFQFYKKGLFGGFCGTQLNHRVTAGGYGETKGKKYWLVKNSWGTEWGESRYVKMKRNIKSKEGICRIAMESSYPVDCNSITCE